MEQEPSGVSHTGEPLQVQPGQPACDGQIGEYWHNLIGNGTHALNMPLDYVRPAARSFAGEVVMLRTSGELACRLERLAEREAVSAGTALLACYILLLSKYTGQDTVCVGWACGPVQQSGWEGGAGLSVLAGQVNWAATWREYVNRIQAICVEASNPRNTPYAEVVKKLNLDRDPSRNPLFDALFQTGDAETGLDKYDFALMPERTEDGILLKLEYDIALFSQASMERFLHHYVNIVEHMAGNLDRELSEIDMLSEAERKRLVHEWNDTAVPYPYEKSIAMLLEEQVLKRPEEIAVSLGAKHLTYRELHGQSNRIAQALHARGIGEEDVVAVMAERSLELVAAVLGVLKAGAAYTPVDPDYPAERLRYLLRHSQAKLLLIQHKFRDRVAEAATEAVSIEDLRAAELTDGNLPLAYRPERLMYVLYTSGSTGNPKGAMIRSHSFVNLLHWYTRSFAFTAKDRILQIASASFDLAQKNLYAALVAGGRLVLFEPGLYDYEHMAETIEREGITVVNCTPSAFYPLVEYAADRGYHPLRSLRAVFLGGEPVHMTKLGPWLRSGQCRAEIVNTYGPTECTDIASYYRLRGEDWTGGDELPIGKPIDNVRLYVVDSELKLVPEGVEGELCIGGAGVGLGYYHAPELTKERFVHSGDLPEETVYRTGDIVKRRPDGHVVFIGRVDHQVKVRGFRIEIEEIERKLLDSPRVREAVVTAGQDAAGDTTLCAYVVAAPGTTAEQVRGELEEKLPAYMVPQHVVLLEAMPLTPNGKLDRRALPEPIARTGAAEDKADGDEAALTDEIGQRLAVFWQEVLGVGRIGPEDNFFRLGGHSLKAIALLARIKKAFGVSLPIQKLFRSPTVRQLAGVIREAPKQRFVSIPRADPQQAYYRLSSQQERLYVLQQFEAIGTAYNVTWAAQVQGPFDPVRCEAAFAAVSQRHESLRTCFEMIGDTVVQNVRPQARGFFEYEDVPGGDHRSLIGPFVRPFELQTGPLFRVKVVRTGHEEHLLLLDMHHMITDGVSQDIVLKEFTALYEGAVLEPLRMQYKDYASWQSGQSGTVREQGRYWLELFQGELPVLDLPPDYPRPVVQSFEGDKLYARLDAERTREVKRLAEATDTTLFIVLLAAYDVLLHKYTGQEDIIVGSPLAGRRHAELEPIVGMFVNTVALRSFPQRDKTVRSFLAEVKESCLKAYEHQEFSFEQLIEQLQLPRDFSRNPLFDTMFVLQNMEGYTPDITNVQMTAYPVNNGIAKFDLTLEAAEKKDGSLQLNLEYCTKLFRRDTMERFLHHYVNIVEHMAGNLDRQLSEIDMLSGAERKRLVHEWNGTAVPYPYEKSIAMLLEEQVLKRPEEIAVSLGAEHLTYRELHGQSNRIAQALHAKGIGEEDVVAVMAERSLELVAALLGVLKAGAAYTPVDPDYPAERLRYLLRHSQAKLLLMQHKFRDRVAVAEADAKAQTEAVSIEDLLAAELTDGNLPLAYRPERLMYVLYTSGSTGNPKGAMIRSHSFVNLLHWYTREFAFTAKDTILQIASASFDLAQKNLYAALVAGGRLVLFEPGLYDYEHMAETIEREGITVINCTPSAFYPLVECAADGGYHQLKSLRAVFLGGEPVHMTKLGPWLRSGQCRAEIINTYGPTECTDIASYYRLRAEDWTGGDELPIGKPIDNVRLYVVDAELKLVPEGVEGELCIGGAGVGRGYYHAPELTKERFVHSGDLPEETVYRTGDIVKRRPDGHVVFIGRVDHQVKVRGFRIEIEEIERKLLNSPRVHEAVVTAGQDAAGDTTLCAYVVAATGTTAEQVRGELEEKLPLYMVPQHVVLLEAMPLTPNGKLDRRALPEPMTRTGAAADGDDTALMDEIGQRLAMLWEEVLGVGKIGPEDNFLRLGGHSLKAIALLARIKKAFGVSLPIQKLFRSPTVRQLAGVIREAPKQRFVSIPQADPQQAYYRLSSQQERLYVLQQFEAIGTAYNVTWAAQVQGPFDPARCEAAFAALSQRHESLRTCFEMIGDTVVQNVLPRARGFFEYEDVPGGDHRSLIGPFVRPFELQTGPLFRVKVVRTGHEEHLLLLDMHHMITDGVSQDIVLKEFTALYEGAVLEPLRMQYKDYASWQSGQSGTVREQGRYWLELFQGELPVLDLPPDYPRPVVQSFEGDKLYARLDAERTREVKRLAEATDTTLFIVLLAAYDVLLHKYTGQEDIIVGSPLAGRRHAELEPIVGMFVNTVALRSFPQRDKTVRSFLAEVKESCLKAYEHQEFSFEQLIEQLQLPRDFSRNPLFDTMFVLQNMEGYTPDIQNVQMTAYPVNNGIAKFDLTLEAAESGDGSLRLNLEYCTKLFRRDTMERFLHHYMNIVEHMAGNLDRQLSEIDMLSGAERKQETYYPASPAQKSIFMADKLSGRGTAYNVPVIRRIKGMLDAGRLEEALKKLVNRHESLRTTIELDADSGMLRQKVNPAVSFAFPVYELSETETVHLIQDFVRPFRLDKPPLFRTALIRLTDREETVLIIDMHHIITDGMSVSILLKDLAALYENRELEVLKLQYKDYAVRQSLLAGTEQWNRQEEYWLGVFHEPVPALPWTGRRTEHRAGEDPSRTAYFALDEQTACALHRLAQTTESTLFMVLMAAFTALLSKLSDCEDIVVGMPTSGRHHEGLDNIVGMLVNTLAVRFFACRKLSFQEYLHQVKDKLIEAYENQDYPLDSLVEKLNGSHNLQGRPLFNVMFQFAETEAAEQIDAMDMVPFGHDSVPGKFDLHFIVVQESSSLGLEITYFESLFSEEAIGELISGFIEIIQVITSNLETGLGDLLKRQSALPST